MKWVYDDGGRSKYFTSTTDDCVARAIAIATGKDYKEVYDLINKYSKEELATLDEVYKITDYFFDKRDFYVNDVSDGMVKLDLYNKRFKLDISDMNIISDTDSEVLVLVSYDNDCAISSFKFSFGRDDDKLYVRNIEVVS